ncbi:hypothetical protein V1517DRAFT_323048 [Lipomyces orientalis]|uniref:Uncharacterized protein n=1 Tax=Lipomyces orientalis TaxID=1233043 RepID=A0ACC3TP96_9ASCO
MSERATLSLLQRRARCYEKLGKFQLAFEDARLIALLDSKNPQAFLYAGEITQKLLYKPSSSPQPTSKSYNFVRVFPAEIILQIFRYLSFPETARLQLVCKSWRTFIEDASSLWTVLDFRLCRGPAIADCVLEKCIKRGKGKVTQISIGYPPDRDFRDNECLSRNGTQLNALFKMTSDLKYARLLPNLHSLHVECYTMLFASKAAYFDEMYGFLERLQEITIEIVNLSGLLHILDLGAVNGLRSIRAVYSLCNLTAEERTVEFLKASNPFRKFSLPKLETISLNGYQWKDMALSPVERHEKASFVRHPRGNIAIDQVSLVRFLSMAGNLERFDCSNVAIQIGHGDVPLDFRRNLNLREVCMRWTRIRHLPVLPASVTKLTISDSTIGDPRAPLPTAEVIMEYDSLHKDSHVIELDLSGTLDAQRNIFCALSADMFRQQGVLLEAILVTYRADQWLRSLDLSVCDGLSFTDLNPRDDATERITFTCTILEHLRLIGNKTVTDNTVRKLRQELDHLIIVEL